METVDTTREVRDSMDTERAMTHKASQNSTTQIPSNPVTATVGSTSQPSQSSSNASTNDAPRLLKILYTIAEKPELHLASVANAAIETLETMNNQTYGRVSSAVCIEAMLKSSPELKMDFHYSLYMLDCYEAAQMELIDPLSVGMGMLESCAVDMVNGKVVGRALQVRFRLERMQKREVPAKDTREKLDRQQTPGLVFDQTGSSSTAIITPPSPIKHEGGIPPDLLPRLTEIVSLDPEAVVTLQNHPEWVMGVQELYDAFQLRSEEGERKMEKTEKRLKAMIRRNAKQPTRKRKASTSLPKRAPTAVYNQKLSEPIFLTGQKQSLPAPKFMKDDNVPSTPPRPSDEIDELESEPSDHEVPTVRPQILMASRFEPREPLMLKKDVIVKKEAERPIKREESVSMGLTRRKGEARPKITSPCHNCGRTRSSAWRPIKVESKDRPGQESPHRLCNPCGIYQSKHGIARPQEIWGDLHDTPVKRRPYANSSRARALEEGREQMDRVNKPFKNLQEDIDITASPPRKKRKGKAVSAEPLIQLSPPDLTKAVRLSPHWAVQSPARRFTRNYASVLEASPTTRLTAFLSEADDIANPHINYDFGRFNSTPGGKSNYFTFSNSPLSVKRNEQTWDASFALDLADSAYSPDIMRRRETASSPPVSYRIDEFGR